MKKWFVWILVLTPLASQAQEWTAEQMEVWARHTECHNTVSSSSSLDEILDCYHKDYVGWWPGNPVPMPISDEITTYSIKKASDEKRVNFVQLKPLHIMVHGDVAIIHSMGMFLSTSEGNEDKTTWANWTDVMLRENEKWYWLADHGTVPSLGE